MTLIQATKSGLDLESWMVQESRSVLPLNNSAHAMFAGYSSLPLFLAAADFGNPDIQEFFNGTLDEIRVYNLALSQAKIQSDMNTLIPRGLIRVSPLRPLICPTSTASVDK